jgi:hypothetical protein
LARNLAATGKPILLLQRGDYLSRTLDHWDSPKVFVDGIYHASETWYGKDGETFHPGLHYYVGGNSKVQGCRIVSFAPPGLRQGHSEGRRLPGRADQAQQVRTRRITPRPKSSSTYTASAARTPTNRPRTIPLRIHLLHMSRRSRQSTRVFAATACIRSTCRSASFSTRRTAEPRLTAGRFARRISMATHQQSIATPTAK